MALYATAKFSLSSLFKAPVSSVTLRGLSVTASASQQFPDSSEPFPPSTTDGMPDNEQMPKRRFINRGINRVELLGGVGGQPVVKQTAQGSAFASFNLYTNVDRRLSNGTSMTSTEVHNVIAFGGMAKYVEKNVERGTKVYLTGRLHYTGGALMVDGTRTPRICSVNLESIYPLSKSGATFR